MPSKIISKYNKLFKNKPKVSNMGRVQYANGKKVYPKAGTSGYSYVGFYGHSRATHIVVTAAFGLIPTNIKQHTVEHKMVGVQYRNDNRLENLVLATPKEQIQSSREQNTDRKLGSKKCEKPILYKLLDSDTWLHYSSAYSFSRDFPVANSSIYRVLSGTRTHANGYEFKYPCTEHIQGEVWKDIKINGTYSGAQVSNKSRFKDIFGVIKTIDIPSDGRRKMCTVNCRQFQYAILVWSAFNNFDLQTDEYGTGKGYQINHINGISSDDRPENLERITSEDHIRHTVKIEGRQSNAQQRSKPVLCKLTTDTEWTLYPSMSNARTSLSLKYMNIKDVILKNGNRAKTEGAHGFYEMKSAYDETQDDLPGEIWVDIEEKHMQPDYFKNLALDLYS
ncbi:hypothetical protein EhVM1_000406 [Emiliania huxleyi virus M1]|uniref:HNH nuclease domain-containing protein n=1 Tax=viral metagenome TaxID=1070528 RepID=A0A6C0LSP4_9ZZZZ|nr:hypothetical protein EhVM1_000406 [Emiliania huxleyi virus M1]|mmetsp:Transcript_22185/g.63043  ORF Transcript_22185/g.63043 Transcript_22185/m.63043 type:complete len:392 (+) Transcript_22185:2647-3822(+)